MLKNRKTWSYEYKKYSIKNYYKLTYFEIKIIFNVTIKSKKECLWNQKL
jgi:hypothetical protein